MSQNNGALHQNTYVR